MKVVFSKRIKEKELGKNTDKRIIDIIVSAIKKWIYDEIKWENLPKNSKLVKLYITASFWDRRAVFLLEVKTWNAIFLFFRDKKDKIGENITIKNKHFQQTLHKYLRIFIEDTQLWNLEEKEV